MDDEIEMEGRKTKEQKGEWVEEENFVGNKMK